MNDVLKRGTASVWDLSDSCAVASLRTPCTLAPLWEPHFNYGTMLLRKVGACHGDGAVNGWGGVFVAAVGIDDDVVVGAVVGEFGDPHSAIPR
jgi:hypothetical protein